MLLEEINKATNKELKDKGLVSNILKEMKILEIELDIYSSQLKDSYYCLPERPDISFYLLWMSVNRAYRDFYLKNKTMDSETVMGAEMVNKITNHLSDQISSTHTIESLMIEYINNYGEQMFNFISNIILKGLCTEKYCKENSLTSKSYTTSQFKTMKNRFENVVKAIEETYLKKYYDNLNDIKQDINKTKVLIESSAINHSILRSLSKQLSELLKREKVKFSQGSFFEEIQLSDNDFVMMYYQTLNAIRNSNIHGNGNSRLSSPNAKKKYMKSSEVTYLAAYFYFGLEMYMLGEVTLKDLSIFEENLKII
ncbi:hypothetical protein ACWN6Y_05575 [Vagococcus teuberi]|uniref:Uncharacterized protein n=1 Tax=Vagococcus teuberi TaxID=519472 RepID=A0A1J0A866_9ENTE|nr:hypothetical protein [Vagococcus teuberi]APB32122.1 hypothetical protein BHY08_10055 [Vagococcus teuberi]